MSIAEYLADQRTVTPSGRTYSTNEVCEITGATLRQVNYWAAQDLIPGQPTKLGQGARRRWTPEQVDVVREIRSTRAGAELRHLRKALHHVVAERDALRKRVAELEARLS